MQKPIHRHFDTHRKTSRLYFDDTEPIECYMRGGICFPVKYVSNDRIHNNGYAVLAGQDVKTNKIHVFEQMNWVTVDDILEIDNKTIKYPGLSHWLNMAWNKYFCRTFYYNQSEEHSRRFRLQILRSKMIAPKPSIVEVPISGKNLKDELLSSLW